jgi:hypothetical protein
MEAVHTTWYQTLARQLWMFIGPAALSLLTILLLDKNIGWSAPRSLAFPIVLAATIALRWVDPLALDSNDPAPPGQKARFTILMLVLGAVLWIGGNAIGMRRSGLW